MMEVEEKEGIGNASRAARFYAYIPNSTDYDAYAPMSSTRARPSKDLIWLFFDPTKNSRGSAYTILVPGHSLDNTHVDDLDWAGAMWKRFKFRVHEPSITFWKVGY